MDGVATGTGSNREPRSQGRCKPARMRCHKFWAACSLGIYVWTTILFKGSLQGEYQRRLYKELLANYNRLERPVTNDSAAILVELGFTLLQIIDVDEKNQVLMTNAWLQLYWTDIYLSWNPESYPGVQNLRFPSDQIWTPDILLYNSADDRFDATFHTNVLVNASGYCQYIPPGILKSTCYIDVRWFPFDVQKCDLKFGSWTHNGWLLDLQMLDVDTSTYIPNGEWDLVAQYFASTMMIVGMSVVVTVIVLQFHHHDPQGGKMPKWVRVVLLNWCAWFLRMKQPGDERRRPGYKHRHTNQHHSSTNSIEMGAIPSLAIPFSQTSCPPCTSGTSNGSMSLYFGSYQPVESPHCPPSSDSGIALGGRTHCSPGDEPEPPNVLGMGVGVGVRMPPPEIQRILEELTYIAQRFRDQDEAEAISSEWKFAAAVVDRLCLVAFSLFSIICTFTILMSAPNFIEAVSKDFT
ncbi:neuronal acetylcholine receptor subunit alpha-7-like isoform X8 [Syngnathoides biaculeatus]|uniref:neuronal acetylcholine receptor subunit alpha-7-like isoform X8 n=1 Tax=Syngnathoides biaculeatus TaxID=300417 RepID=UPI002ADD943F|nr:neuronal acetylcholine receptor subunit alpha-7-like isoform X8 [Syngnathoides biaculeatus]